MEALWLLKVVRKLQRLKGDLIVWNKEAFGNVDIKVKRLEYKLLAAQIALDNDIKNLNL